METVDAAFQTLQNRTGSTRLLKDSDGSQLKFVKEQWLKNGDLGVNEEVTTKKTFLGFEYDRSKHRTIRIADWNESSKSLNDRAISTVIHEIGHNWDSTAEAGKAFAKFATLSWQDGKLYGYKIPFYAAKNQKSADFAQLLGQNDRPYGRTNAKEDWSSMWQAYFNDDLAGTSATYQRKWAAVDKFFDGI